MNFNTELEVKCLKVTKFSWFFVGRSEACKNVGTVFSQVDQGHRQSLRTEHLSQPKSRSPKPQKTPIHFWDLKHFSQLCYSISKTILKGLIVGQDRPMLDLLGESLD